MILANVLRSFLVKGGSILVSLLLIPMTITYVSPLHYGVWLTVSSIVNWMSFFDIGFGNGLRNKLAEAISLEDYGLAKKYVSTTYCILSIIALVLLVVIWTIIPIIDWKILLNIPSSASQDIVLVVLIVASTFCMQFILQLLNVVLFATQQSAKAAFISFLGQVLVLIVISVLKETTNGSLINLVLALTLAPVFTMAVASFVLFRNSPLTLISPSLSEIKLGAGKNVLNVGGVFFIIQIGAMVLFQTDNIIISKIMGPHAVTEFNVAYKLFSVLIMVFNIILTPFWSAYTEAFTKKDYHWIKEKVKILRKLWMCAVLGTLVLSAGSKSVYHIWVGDAVEVETSLIVAMGCYVVVYIWQTIHVFLLNGIGKVRLQLVLVIVSAIINVPLAIFLGKLWGLPGIITANTAVFAVMGLMFAIQVDKINSQKASGIWDL